METLFTLEFIWSSSAAVLSIITMYLLNNQHPNSGRVFGLLSALTWGTYAYYTNQIPLIVVDVVYVIIYIQSWLKFKAKRDSYREKDKENRNRIASLLRTLRKK